MVNLKEYIHPKMDILFLALNAPEVSNANAHWFSRNLSFWNLLYQSGLINQPISDPKEGDETVFGSNEMNLEGKVFGVTDLNNEIVQTDSRGVNVEERHLKRILDILRHNKVEKLCLMHSTVGSVFRTSGHLEKTTGNRYGLIGYINQTEVYEVPFHNAPVANKEQFYRHLRGDSPLVGKVPKSPDVKSILKNEKKSTTFLASCHASFTIPKPGNFITEKDIEKGVLRITADFKNFFPPQNSTIKIQVGNVTKSTPYEIKEGKSSLLRIGRDLMSALKLKPGNRLQFEKLHEGNGFEIKKQN